MTRPRSRRLLTLLAAAGALAVVGFAGVYWEDIAAWVRFYQLFESVGLNEQGYPEYRHRQTGIVLVRVPGGTFMMGVAEEEKMVTVVYSSKESAEALHSVEREQSQHEVTLSPFLIAKYEITQAVWRRVMGTDPSMLEGDGSPVTGVSWDDCKEFARKTELPLPTEAQWEYTCRAGSKGPVAGTGKLDDMGWYRDNSGRTTHRVGQKQPNSLGLHDMHGNVWEWCADVFDGRFYSRTEARDPDPIAVSGSDYRVIRGGCYVSYPEECASACRGAEIASTDHNYNLGFRPAYWPLPPGL